VRISRWPIALVIGFAGVVYAEGPHPTGAAWPDRTDLRDQGIQQCRLWRQELLRPDTGGKRRLDLVASAMERFPGACQTALHGRPDLSTFHISAADVVRQVSHGATIDAHDALDGFSGHWYGLWDHMRVDHDWHAVQMGTSPATTNGGLAAVQYAWIGDGFAWNYVVNLDRHRPAQVLFGMCYHLAAADATKIRLRRPHVGYYAGVGKLVWITAREIFFEQLVPKTEDGGPKYVITGFVYQIRNGQLRNDGNGFQAIYTRRPDARPPWFQFQLDLVIGAAR